MKTKISSVTLGVCLAVGLVLDCKSTLRASADTSQPTIQLNPPSICQGQRLGKIYARTELFFGLSKPNNATVTNAEFQDFIDRVVTPLFPDGLTWLAGMGQFRNSSGKIIIERSRLLILLYPFSPDTNAKVEQIRDKYKRKFQQESVLRVDDRSCVSF